MKHLILVTLLAIFLSMSFGTSFAEIKGTVMLPNLEVGNSPNVSVSITVSTDSSIGIAQFVVEYNSSVLSYVNSQLGADAPSGFSVSNTNPNLPFNPTTPGTDENVLIQVSGGGSKNFSGSGLEIVIIKFDLVGNFGDTSPLAFDEGATKTRLSTANLYDIDGNELEFGNGSVNYSVPVELSSFNVFTNQGKIFLEWSTESETNNFGFEIQRKEAGENFKKIGFVPGHGTTTSLHHYKYTDADLPQGSYYYRLKQMDHNGSFEISEVKSVVLSTPSGFNLENNFPNPFNSGTVLCYQIGYEFGESVEVKLLIYNSLGELVKTLLNEHQSAGRYSVTWDGRDNNGISVGSGIYINRLIAKNHISSIKMIYMK